MNPVALFSVTIESTPAIYFNFIQLNIHQRTRRGLHPAIFKRRKAMEQTKPTRPDLFCLFDVIFFK